MKQNEMNPITWNKEQWKDALIGVVLTTLVFAEVFFVVAVF